MTSDFTVEPLELRAFASGMSEMRQGLGYDISCEGTSEGPGILGGMDQWLQEWALDLERAASRAGRVADTLAQGVLGAARDYEVREHNNVALVRSRAHTGALDR